MSLSPPERDRRGAARRTLEKLEIEDAERRPHFLDRLRRLFGFRRKKDDARPPDERTEERS